MMIGRGEYFRRFEAVALASIKEIALLVANNSGHHFYFFSMQ